MGPTHGSETNTHYAIPVFPATSQPTHGLTEDIAELFLTFFLKGDTIFEYCPNDVSWLLKQKEGIKAFIETQSTHLTTMRSH
jgi:hypothetical protein